MKKTASPRSGRSKLAGVGPISGHAFPEPEQAFDHPLRGFRFFYNDSQDFAPRLSRKAGFGAPLHTGALFASPAFAGLARRKRPAKGQSAEPAKLAA
jgi:hypothetical protein